MKRLLFLIINTFIIPVFIINFFYNYNNKYLKTGFINNQKESINIRILKSDNTVENIDLEDYLVGVISSEVPISYKLLSKAS